MTLLINTFLYIAVFVASGYCFYLGITKNNKSALYASLLLPIILAGLRFIVGTDYESYMNITDSITKNESFLYILSAPQLSIEVAPKLLMKVGGLFGVGAQLFFVVCAALTVLFYWLSCRKLDSKYAALVYMTLLLTVFPSALNQVRQGVAIAMCLYAIFTTIDKRIITSVSLITMAATFHFSALLLLLLIPLYYVGREKFFQSSKTLTIAVLTTTICTAMFSVISVLVPRVAFLAKYADYFATNTSSLDFKDLFIIYIPILIISLATRYFGERKHSILDELLPYSILSLVFAYTGPMLSLFERATTYMLPVAILLGVVSACQISDKLTTNDRFSRVILVKFVPCAIIFIAIGYFGYAYALNSSGAGIMPYNTFFSV